MTWKEGECVSRFLISDTSTCRTNNVTYFQFWRSVSKYYLKWCAYREPGTLTVRTISLPKTVEFFPVSFERNSRNLRVRINAIKFIFFEADVRPFEIRITVWCKRNQNWLRSFLRFSADCNDGIRRKLDNSNFQGKETFVRDTEGFQLSREILIAKSVKGN